MVFPRSYCEKGKYYCKIVMRQLLFYLYFNTEIFSDFTDIYIYIFTILAHMVTHSPFK